MLRKVAMVAIHFSVGSGYVKQIDLICYDLRCHKMRVREGILYRVYASAEVYNTAR